MTLKFFSIILLVVSSFCLLYPADILQILAPGKNFQEASQSVRIAGLFCLLFFAVLFLIRRHKKNKKRKIFSIKNSKKLSLYRESQNSFPSFSLLIFFCTVLVSTVLFASHLYNDNSFHANPDAQTGRVQVLMEK